MNHREPRLASAAARKAFQCLTLLLLPTILPRGILAGARSRASVGGGADRLEAEPAPYLPNVGSPPLRFEEVQVAQEPPLRHAETQLSSPGSQAAQAPSAAGASESAKPSPETHDVAKDTPSAPAAAPSVPPPVPILPDTARPQVQAEDFLPYFMIPGSERGADSAPRASEPGRLPPSSATYTQTPK
jgi:hypothetical protein